MGRSLYIYEWTSFRNRAPCRSKGFVKNFVNFYHITYTALLSRFFFRIVTDSQWCLKSIWLEMQRSWMYTAYSAESACTTESTRNWLKPPRCLSIVILNTCIIVLSYLPSSVTSLQACDVITTAMKVKANNMKVNADVCDVILFWGRKASWYEDMHGK